MMNAHKDIGESVKMPPHFCLFVRSFFAIVESAVLPAVTIYFNQSKLPMQEGHIYAVTTHV